MTSPGTFPKRFIRGLAILVLVLILAAVAAGLWFRSRVAASLPLLDGNVTVNGLSSTVRITRDALGVPTVEGKNRLDVARATGWLHAQDRFFQMDILRRRGAGELAELFGAAALPLDRDARMHAFRTLAREVLEREAPERRALIRAYADGVNDGLAALAAKPWEYVVLRTDPRAWLPEDTFLISYAMTLDLQESTGRYVRSLAAIRDELGPASLAFFAPLSTPTDAALDGSAAPAAPPPPAAELDLRTRDSAAAQGAPTSGLGSPSWTEAMTPGSNSIAVAGALASGGGALVANDIHLHLGVPNIWYRISLKWPGHEETGISIPGAPVLVAGSTGKIAWGFTNSNAGVGDVLLIDPSISPDLYHGPHGGDLVRYEHRIETVRVRGSKPVAMDFKWTIWGPVVADGTPGRPLVYHWAADDPASTNLGLVGLEEATNVRDAVEIAHHVGVPALNFVVADAAGQIAWTIAGQIPNRIGYDGRLPVTWLYGDRRWNGFLPSAQVPSIIAPANGRLWTANNRTVGGRSLALLGDAGYDIPARARQIRDDLAALVDGHGLIAPKDLLGVQLDDRALLMGVWHDVLLQTLTPAVVAQGVGRGALLDAARTWEGRADVGSVSYRVVRDFRLAVAHRVFDPIFATCIERYPDFTWTRIGYEQPLETLLKTKPAHLLLDPAFHTWDELLVAAADDVAAGYAKQGLDPRKATWGQRNTVRIEHPLARLVPRWAAAWMNMPADELPGDSYMPRVQDGSFGASERFVVSPGHEAEGIFHMPGGECANPLSPYFRAGHDAWVRGDATPFLPGAAQHTLTLDP